MVFPPDVRPSHRINETVKPFDEWAVFGIYEKNKFMVAGEYNKLAPRITLSFPNLPIPFPVDKRQWYGMASYKVTGKFSAGIYDSQQINHALPFRQARRATRRIGSSPGATTSTSSSTPRPKNTSSTEPTTYYDANLNPGGLKPTTKLTILKMGVSF